VVLGLLIVKSAEIIIIIAMGAGKAKICLTCLDAE